MRYREEPTFTTNMAVALLLEELDRSNRGGFTAMTTTDGALIIVSRMVRVNERLVELLEIAGAQKELFAKGGKPA